jgi:hypothetical protein
MCAKIDVMERDCKKLEFGGDLSKALTEVQVGQDSSFNGKD